MAGKFQDNESLTYILDFEDTNRSFCIAYQQAIIISCKYRANVDTLRMGMNLEKVVATSPVL